MRIEERHSSLLAVLAFGCFVGSVTAALFGILLTTRWLFNADVHPILNALGLTLLFMAIPILILGGHCLDLLEKPRNEKSQIYRQSAISEAIRTKEEQW